MENKNKLLAMEIRLHKLKTNGKNEDSPGVVRKLERKIRKIKDNQERVYLSFLFKEKLCQNLKLGGFIQIPKPLR